MADWDATVGLTPEYTFPTTATFKTLISTGEAGKERRRSKRSIQRGEWKLKFGYLTETEADLIWAFYLARKGAYEAFTWQDPVKGGAPISVRFKDDSLTKAYFQFNSYSLSLTFIEV